MHLETERLILRRWTDADLDPFAEMSADIEVMRWLGGVLTREQSQAYMDRAHDAFARIGMGRYAVERKSDGAFIGSTGLMPNHESMLAFVPPYIDMGWRLRQDAWGHGYITEAARAVVADGFGRLDLPEITATTAAINLRSRAVMERLGMTYDEAVSGFIGPMHEPDDPQGPTVIYRLKRP